MVLILVLYQRYKHNKESRAKQVQQENIEAGLTEPASLHPVIDAASCIACGACVSACPEGDILGIIGGRGELVNPSHCIGHGACRAACPVDAITLVFGTEKRGVDIPHVAPDFETNVPGIYIAGELGGMGLIGNAIEQGQQAMDSIARKIKGTKGGPELDVLIVGAGPAGISATLNAKKQGLNYLTIDQETMGGTVAHFPRGKIVMTRPVNLPIFGKVKLRETTKEALLELWEKVIQETGIKISTTERLEAVTPIDNGFEVTTSKGKYQSKTILLSIGRRGTPRKLGVPGEDQNKVVYRLIDPAQYTGQHVLVVGGGDSALEAACSIADEADTTVTISYRSEAFSRAKEKNRQRVDNLKQAGRLNVMLSSQVKNITADEVEIDAEGQTHTIKNDGIIVCAGGILPTPFLKEIGVSVETKHGTA
jgi:thioredoxin reductase/ferredoxin